MNKNKRVVITGIGIISSVGIGKDEFWKNLINGKSGISKIESIDTANYPIHFGGEIKNFNPDTFIDKRRSRLLGRASQLAISASRLALEDAALQRDSDTIKDNVGVCIGTTMGETINIEEIDAIWNKKGTDSVNLKLISNYPSNVISFNVGFDLKLKGTNFVLPTACAAGNYAIGYCYDQIINNGSQIMLAGGADAFSRIAFTGFNRLYAMAPEKCQPFDKNRKGMMLGEGAGILVLESLESAKRRKATIYAEILGYGLSCDAHHMTQPSQEGVEKCFTKALKDADIGIEDVDYISVHGTGTQQNDKTETGAIKKVFGKRYKKIPVSSIKSMLGHTMGAAAAIEAAACCLALQDSVLPPTINFETPDLECDIDCVSNKARKQKVELALNNSCAFGGNNACVVLKKLLN